MTYFRFVAVMNSLDIRKFCRDTCHWTQQLPTGYNLGHDIVSANRKVGCDSVQMVVATLFLLSFTLVSKILVAIGKTMSRHHISASFIATELLMS